MSGVNPDGDLGQLSQSSQLRCFCAMVSKAFGYSLRAATFITLQRKNKKRISLLELSQSLDIPRHILGKIMEELVWYGIMDSPEEPIGGFFANTQTAETSLVDILIIRDGSLVFTHCALNIKRCDAEHPCPLHNDFRVSQDGMLK
ncbi:MAG: Rrf2 family transcriptional regulator [Saprospiraceae bacterium]